MEINRQNISEWLKKLQSDICFSLQTADGLSSFNHDVWERELGGGGISKVIENGAVIEKGGVMFSAVHGKVPEFLLKEQSHSVIETKLTQADTFFATGVSIVIHPKNPMVPIIHMNIRYFEMSNGVRWLGGGIDLTPHYIVDSDAKFFHQQLKSVCDQHHKSYYSKFKTWADDYFYIKHRSETRGIGGIFFDRLSSTQDVSFEQNFAFWQNVGQIFSPTYLELITRNKNKSFTTQNKQWQLLRRGRYVEFNLVYDKGTRFGLETDGRIESILMSLPTHASWIYNFKPSKNSEEDITLSKLKKDIDWLKL
jgi:coproporphyrinogen III oxidase